MANANNTTIYFGYGSNLWRHQMAQRCPTSTFLGVARLNGYQWIINERGYANVVEVAAGEDEVESHINHPAKHDYAHEVYGLVYTLLPSDEARLDRNEGVPVAYTKEVLGCDFWNATLGDGGVANVTAKPEKVDMLVYINRHQVKPSEPKEEYVYRMNRGIEDAVREGVPEGYVREVMRRFIGEDGVVVDGAREEVALRQAEEFEEE